MNSDNSIDVSQFNLAAKRIEKLTDTNLPLAHKEILRYQEYFEDLTLKQKVLFYQLLSDIYLAQSKFSLARNAASKGLQLGKQLATPSIHISELLYIRGFAIESLGDTYGANQDYKKGLEVAESLHNKVYIAYGLINLGAIYYLTDDYERSLELLNDAYNIAKQTSDEELKGAINSELGILYSYLKQDKRSREFYQQSYIHFKKAGKPSPAYNNLLNIATNHNTNRRYDEAIDVLKKILNESMFTPSNDSEVMYGVYSGLAWAYTDKENSNPEAAYQYLQKAKQYIDLSEQDGLLLRYYISEAFALFELKQYDETLVSISNAERLIFQKKELSSYNKESYISLLNLRANTFFEQKKFKQAYQYKSDVIHQIEKIDRQKNSVAIERARIKLESKQADMRNQRLKDEKLVKDATLTEVELANKEQNIYLMLSGLFAFAFAWLLLKLISNQNKLKKASSTDPTTGVANRYTLMTRGSRAFSRAELKHSPFSVLMIDIDAFKNINERLGHELGDKTLRIVSNLGQQMMRKTDVFGRYGGEEFTILLPNTTSEQAHDIAKRLRSSLVEFPWHDELLEPITISAGVSGTDDAASTNLLSLIKMADKNLYQAKSTGKDKVCS